MMQSMRAGAFTLWAALAFAMTSFAGGEKERRELEALEAKCEQAREAKLKPLREAEIARCKAEKRNDPGYCERYWRDYGAAMRRPNKTIQPRMFDDLPECVAARERREKEQ